MYLPGCHSLKLPSPKRIQRPNVDRETKTFNIKKIHIDFIDQYTDDSFIFIFSHNAIHNDKNSYRQLLPITKLNQNNNYIDHVECEY